MTKRGLMRGKNEIPAFSFCSAQRPEGLPFSPFSPRVSLIISALLRRRFFRSGERAFPQMRRIRCEEKMARVCGELSLLRQRELS